MNHVAVMEQLFRTRLSQMKFKNKSKINIIGLAIGVDVSSKDYAILVQQKCMRKGLLINAELTSLIMFPPLIIEKQVAEEGLNILEECL
jgi:4-aminobutyrate aminotransferase-like enzyme